MTESEFLALADATLRAIEAGVERAAEESGADLECSRSGNVLEIEFIDSGAKIIVNSQAPMQEMWAASRLGGFHYRREGEAWRDTRDGSELFAALSRTASSLAGETLTITPA